MDLNDDSKQANDMYKRFNNLSGDMLIDYFKYMAVVEQFKQFVPQTKFDEFSQDLINLISKYSNDFVLRDYKSEDSTAIDSPELPAAGIRNIRKADNPKQEALTDMLRQIFNSNAFAEIDDFNNVDERQQKNAHACPPCNHMSHAGEEPSQAIFDRTIFQCEEELGKTDEDISSRRLEAIRSLGISEHKKEARSAKSVHHVFDSLINKVFVTPAPKEPVANQPLDKMDKVIIDEALSQLPPDFNVESGRIAVEQRMPHIDHKKEARTVTPKPLKPVAEARKQRERDIFLKKVNSLGKEEKKESTFPKQDLAG